MLEIWDSVGCSDFHTGFDSVDGFLFVYSVTSRDSFLELPRFKQEAQSQRGEDVPIMIIGNKSDLSERQVETTEGICLANEWKCSFMERSAKTNQNVVEGFTKIATERA